MKKKVFLILALFSFAFATAQNIDVKHYDIHVNEIDYQANSISCFTEVTFEALTDVNSIVLELKALTISEMLLNNGTDGISGYQQVGDSVFINFTSVIPYGSLATVGIYYHGVTFSESSFGGVHWHNGVMYNLGVGFASQPHNLGKAWFPCVDNMTDKATFDVYVTVPENLTAVCGGLLIDKTSNSDGSFTWHWCIPQEITTYAASVAVGEYELYEDVYNGIEADIPINIFVKASNINNISTSFGRIKEICHTFEEWFGPYPFNRIGYCETRLGCMEHVDNIAFASSLINVQVSGEEYAAHELSHMWFGNKVTCTTPQDMWLNEGFATFCATIFKTALYDEQTYLDMIAPVRDRIVNWCDQPQNWIPLNNIPESITYDSDGVYDRGCVVAATLMNYIGRETFLNALKQYLERHAYSTASSENLRDDLTEFTGVDMNGFFDTWVFTPGMPHFAVETLSTQPNGNQYDATVTMSYTHRGAEHIGQHNICKVTFFDENMNTFTDTICWDGEFCTRTKQLDFQPVYAVADYDNEYLAAVLNNKITITHGSGFKSLVRFFELSKDVNDSVFVYAANHLVGPKETETDPALKISTRHYWSVFFKDYGDNEFTGRFTFSRNTWDNDIVTSQSDSAVLLYRRDASEPWQSLDYEQEGTWQMARFTVSNLQPGDYVIGAWDKNLLDVKEYQPVINKMTIFPNPADDSTTIEWVGKSSGVVTVCNEKGRQMVELPYSNTDRIVINTSRLGKGVYVVTRIDTKNNIKETSKIIIK